MPAKDQAKRAWVVSVDIGYGHQRAAYPLNEIANERIITANNNQIISERERGLWNWTRIGYETVSRLKSIPGIGKFIFGAYDSLQSIAPFYPFKVDVRPNLTVLRVKGLVKRWGLCASLIDYVKREKLPLVTPHFFPALAAYDTVTISYLVTARDSSGNSAASKTYTFRAIELTGVAGEPLTGNPRIFAL
jgi:hypothetical protein